MEPNSFKKELPFFTIYERFVADSLKGKRLQPNGKRFSHGTIRNYVQTQKLLIKFCQQKEYYLRFKSVRCLNKRKLEVERNYWKKFYRRFTDFLYYDCGHFDNYVGQTIKNIRVFFGYTNKELGLNVGQFYKLFYVRKEEIGIYPLLPEELNFFIYNKEFENTLSKRMREVKDFFVFGCTVALRVSDLLSLQKSNIRIVNEQYYLAARSIKTATNTLIKLPQYAIKIALKYGKNKKLLPHFNRSNLNKYIKRLLELAGFTHPVRKMREIRGRSVEIKNENKNYPNNFRFCDVASTHTMRRTAITAMLSLGMPEQLVRKISGHSPGSKEFYRYVLWAQTYQDMETEKVFEKLGLKF